MKQYTVVEAYVGNDAVTVYEDGNIVDHVVMTYQESYNYCQRLEAKGYERAFDIELYEQLLLEAKEAYENAREIYEYALDHPLYVDRKVMTFNGTPNDRK